MLTKSNVSSFTLIPVLFVLALFLLLATLSISVILSGSAVYEKISANMESNYDRRVTFSYLATKIRQNDIGGNIYIEDKEGVPMIAIKEVYDDEEFVTYIYHYDGAIREIFLDIDSIDQFEFDWGDEIIKAEGFEFQFSEAEEKIEMSLTSSQGQIQSTRVVLRSGR